MDEEPLHNPPSRGPPSYYSSPNPGETLPKNKKRVLHPRNENRRISLLVSSLMLCSIPWPKGNWRGGGVCWTYGSESQYIIGGNQGRDLRQVGLLFHIALPLTKELTRSQRNIAGVMEKGPYWLSPKRIKVGKEEEEVTKKLNCLNFWKTFPGKDVCLLFCVCLHVYPSTYVCIGHGTFTHICTQMWGKS